MLRLTDAVNAKALKAVECTISLSDSLALRAYSDTRPHNWDLADLQKGLILVINGVETVGEGAGFGVPILLFSEERYFSGSSHIYLSNRNGFKIIRKEFLMDTVPKKRYKKTNVGGKRLRTMSRYLGKLYQKHRRIPLLALNSLLLRMGFHTSFVKTAPAGKVIATYAISGRRIRVRIDLNDLERKNLQKVVVLNEQGSSFFRRYSDSNGTELVDGQIGSWETVEAEWASIKDSQSSVGFRLGHVENSILRRGREFLEGSLDWVGLDYEFTPKDAAFEYTIDLLGG